jgi:hypothetical protein
MRSHAILAGLMRTRFDQFGKQMVRTALAARGPVETDAEVPADTRRIDLWFMPDPSLAPVPDHLGLLGRITAGPSTLEFFHNTPSGEELAGCLIKHGEFRHFLSLRKAPPPIPMQWVISSGRPESGIEGLWLRPMNSWPAGIYEGPPLLWTRLMVVSELPVARDTLLLRLLGANRVLQQAIAELKALGAEAPERTLALPILLRLRLEVPADPTKRTNDDQEFLMNTQDIVETWRREAIQEGVKQGIEEGVKQGIEEGVKQGIEEGVKQGIERGIARSLIDIYEARFGAMPEEIRAVIEDTHDEPTLRAWLKLAGTCGTDEIAAAIHAFRAS